METHDLVTLSEAYAKPGIDPRQWCSFATVDPEAGDQKSVQFTNEYGPLVSCTLHPSGIPVVCRVAHEVAGNGEGEWFPFVAGDEVIVLIPEGDEAAGCTIVGRLNQEIDQWPQLVAGQDSTTNTFAFRRLRTPYVVETSSSYLIRSATTGAFMGINPQGAVTIANADNGFLALSSSFLGLQNGDADVLMQIDVQNKQVVLEAAGTKLTLDGLASTFIGAGTLNIGTSGLQGTGHALTLEQYLNLTINLIVVLNALGAWNPPFSATLAGAFNGTIETLLTAWLPGAVAPIPATASSPGGDMTQFGLPAFVLAALAAQVPDPAAFGLPVPVLPGVGRAGLLY